MSTTAAQQIESCPYCGLQHPITRCGRIKAIQYFPDGKVQRVEFHDPIGYVNPGPFKIGDISYSGGFAGLPDSQQPKTAGT